MAITSCFKVPECTAPSLWRTAVRPELAFRTKPDPRHPPWQGEYSGGTADQVRWVQSSLNTVLSLRLTVDGVAGPATRSAIRSFQQRQGLTPDGVVGPQTQAALEAALRGTPTSRSTASGSPTPMGGPGQTCDVLDDFGFDEDQLTPAHMSKLASIARKIINSQSASARIVGYTDPVGDFNYNFELGKRRAVRVATQLRRMVGSLRPGSAGQLTLVTGSGGETHAVSADPRRDRRVEICLPPVTIQPLAAGNPDPEPITRRYCCLLAPQQINSLTANDNIADPAHLGQHGGSSEVTGILYSGKAGFLDLSHMRDSCDTTKYIYDQIASSGIPHAIFVKYRRTLISASPVGVAVIHQRPLRPIDTARAIAYDVGMGHEIATYYKMGTLGVDVGGHNSSFSPEDLCSNFLGTLLAERAIAAGGNFNNAVTAELNTLIHDLDAQTPAETLSAFKLINGRWVAFSWTPWQRFYESITRPDYLRRRNFTRTPWAAGHRSDKPPPPYVVAALPNPGPAAYTYTHTEESSMKRLNVLYPRYINLIKQDAQQRYGPRFDKPN